MASYTSLSKFTLILITLLFSGKVFSQDPELQHIAGNVWWLKDKEGNKVLLISHEGMLMVDAGSEKSARADLKRFDTLYKNHPVKYLINSHYHPDQTGGNEIFGRDATVVMHANCKSALIRQFEASGASSDVLKNVVTWKEGMKFNFGNETVRLLYYGNAHTCGDLVVVFERAKVVYMGDLLCSGIPPDADVANNSDTQNWIRILNNLFSEYVDYVYVPGRGPLSNVLGLKKYSSCLSYLREQVSAAVSAGKSREEVIAGIDVERFTSMKDPRPEGNLTIQRTIGQIYDEMARSKK